MYDTMNQFNVSLSFQNSFNHQEIKFLVSKMKLNVNLIKLIYLK